MTQELIIKVIDNWPLNVDSNVLENLGTRKIKNNVINIFVKLLFLVHGAVCIYIGI